MNLVPAVLKRTTALTSCLIMLLAALGPATAETAAQSASNADKPPIKIGFLVPLSGQSAEAGQRILDGAKLYLDQCHKMMGGRKVDFIVENDESNAATAVAKVHKLVEQDKVDLMAGMYLSSCLYAIAPVVDTLQVPFVVVSSGANDVTQRKRKKWIVRTCYTSTICAHPMAEYAYKNLKMRKIVTLGSDYAYGYEAVGGFQQTFEELGGQVIQKLWLPLGFTDFKPILKQIRSDADGVYTAFAGQSAELIPKQYKELGIKTPMIGVLASFDESFYPRMADELNGGISTSLYSTALDTPANKRFVRDYQARYNSAPSYYGEHGYAAMMFINKAIDSLKGNVQDKDKLLAALMKTDIVAPRGPIRIDDHGSAIVNIYVRRTERVGRTLQNTVIYTYPTVSQFWKYGPEDYMRQPAYSKGYPICTHCTQQ
jgi:branched-chain amino acid transport system substrate-binding protein